MKTLAPLLFFVATAFAAESAITPGKTIALFDGKDLAAFDLWLGKFGHENKDNVFTVVKDRDGLPAIRVSGEHWGGFVTKRSYTNYRLVLSYRWGVATSGERKEKARNSGVLLHCQGAFGNYTDDFTAPWMRSVEFEIIEGGTGDFILVRGFDAKGGKRIMPELTATVAPSSIVWQPDGTPTRFPNDKLKPSGRIWWRGRDPDFKDVLGFRGRQDVERPLGEWNTAELVCRGGDVTFVLNGVTVNRGTDGTFTEGKILFQSEGAEIYFRGITLHPLSPAN